MFRAIIAVPITRSPAAGSRRIPKHCRFCCRVARIHWSPAAGTRFLEKVATLEERLKLSDERPLLVVSDTRARTGALMRWCAFHPVEWRGNLFYSDFDNDFDTDIFGVRVTGFLQDQELLFKEAAAKLKRTLNGTPDAEPGLQVYPEFRDADT